MKMINYYEILGVPENATLEEIKKAYRKKASVAHPDKGGDVEMMKQVNVAYDLLKTKSGPGHNQVDWDEIKNLPYDSYPFFSANGLLVGVINA